MTHQKLTIKTGASTICFIWHPHQHNQQMKLRACTICCMGIPTNQARRKRKPVQLASSNIPTKTSQMKMGASTICFIGHPHKITNKKFIFTLKTTSEEATIILFLN